MDKADGVPLSQVWDAMDLTQKLRLLLAVTSLQKRWLRISFSHYGSLYYTGDVKERAGNHYAKKDGEILNSPKRHRDLRTKQTDKLSRLEAILVDFKVYLRFANQHVAKGWRGSVE
jgi:hypothetical protein